jgi:hypothetical protein
MTKRNLPDAVDPEKENGRATIIIIVGACSPCHCCSPAARSRLLYIEWREARPPGAAAAHIGRASLTAIFELWMAHEVSFFGVSRVESM